MQHGWPKYHYPEKEIAKNHDINCFNAKNTSGTVMQIHTWSYRQPDLEERDKSLNELVNDEAVPETIFELFKE